MGDVTYEARQPAEPQRPKTPDFVRQAAESEKPKSIPRVLDRPWAFKKQSVFGRYPNLKEQMNNLVEPVVFPELKDRYGPELKSYNQCKIDIHNNFLKIKREIRANTTDPGQITFLVEAITPYIKQILSVNEQLDSAIRYPDLKQDKRKVPNLVSNLQEQQTQLSQAWDRILEDLKKPGQTST